ncbi:hypothetical protein DFH28DRAFT_824096, partial [Melampsora americana]
AQFYVDSEHLPVGDYPGGSFYKTDAITLDFFEEDKMVQRAAQVKKSMDFLHTLIERELAGSSPNKESYLHAMSDTGHGDSDDETNGSLTDRSPDDGGVEDDLEFINQREGVSYSKK